MPEMIAAFAGSDHKDGTIRDEDKPMDFGGIIHFLFETMPGVGVLVGATLVISIIVSFIFERRTRKIYQNHEPSEDDWFDDSDEDEDDEEDK